MDKKDILLPQHVAIIMDGNGRWAKQRGLKRTEGHKVGAEVFRTISKYCADIGIKYVTFYAFSTENWKRSKAEVTAIMNLLRRYLDEMKERVLENEEAGIHISFIGSREGMPKDIVKLMDEVDPCGSISFIIHRNGWEVISFFLTNLFQKSDRIIEKSIDFTTLKCYAV